MAEYSHPWITSEYVCDTALALDFPNSSSTELHKRFSAQIALIILLATWELHEIFWSYTENAVQ